MFKLILICLLFLTQAQAEEVPPAVTYEFSGGRFGDNLLSYLHAKWISYRCQIPLLYKPFPYSSELLLDQLETPFLNSNYAYVKTIEGQKTLDAGLQNSTLYISLYFPEDPYELQHVRPQEGFWHAFPVDWKDEGFRAAIAKALTPRSPLNLVKIPEKGIRVALHFREGGGIDDATAQKMHPLRFPSLDFYINGLQKVLELFPKSEIYCYLFTDASDPESIVQLLKKKVGKKIHFDYRKEGNRHDAQVLEDFFSLLQFDILIRPQSNFSLVPSLLGTYAMIYSPKSYIETKNFFTRKKKRVIDQVNLLLDENRYQKLLENL